MIYSYKKRKEEAEMITMANVGENVKGKMFVKSVNQGTTKAGNPYLDLFLADKNGEINAKVWENVEQAVGCFVPNTIVYVEGDIKEFKGVKQLTVTVFEPTEGNLEDFIKTAPVSSNETFAKIWRTLRYEIRNPNIAKITERILEKYEKHFKEYPAAKGMHHAYVGGLSYHTCGMLNIAKSIVELYPFLNKDLLFAGVILHDVCKVREYTDPVNPNYSIEGKLIGHISMIAEEIELVAKDLEIKGEEVLLLKHMVLSHHGKLEWGSPVQPMIPEAEMLHFIDNMDAKMEMYRSALEKIEPGQFSDRIAGLEGRTVYKHRLQ